MIPHDAAYIIIIVGETLLICRLMFSIRRARDRGWEDGRVYSENLHARKYQRSENGQFTDKNNET